MRSILICLSVFFSFSIIAQNKVQRQLESLERQRFEAMTKKDAAFLQNVLDDGLTYTHSNGFVENKTQHIDNIKSGFIEYRSMQPESANIQVFKKTAVINGFVKVGGVYKDAEFNIRLRYMDVYIKKRGKWKLAAWQSVKVD
jgi:hypothetical protein